MVDKTMGENDSDNSWFDDLYQSTERPTAALDHRIKSAAHEAVKSRYGYWTGLATAATLVLAVLLYTGTGEQHIGMDEVITPDYGLPAEFDVMESTTIEVSEPLSGRREAAAQPQFKTQPLLQEVPGAVMMQTRQVADDGLVPPGSTAYLEEIIVTASRGVVTHDLPDCSYEAGEPLLLLCLEQRMEAEPAVQVLVSGDHDCPTLLPLNIDPSHKPGLEIMQEDFSEVLVDETLYRCVDEKWQVVHSSE